MFDIKKALKDAEKINEEANYKSLVSWIKLQRSMVKTGQSKLDEVLGAVDKAKTADELKKVFTKHCISYYN